jgi:hypothetical protein
MQLSVLIPAIPERWDIGNRLYMKLLKMSEGKDIEILYFMDNKKRSAPQKYNDLLNMVRGKYFMFCHDDDDILTLDEVYQETFKDVDVITFKQLCDSPNPQKTPYTVTFGLGNPVESFKGPVPGSYGDCRRPPWTVCAWNQRFKTITFDDVYGEDGPWVEKVTAIAKTESFIDIVVCRYNWDVYVTSDPKYRKDKKEPVVQAITQTIFPFIRRGP